MNSSSSYLRQIALNEFEAKFTELIANKTSFLAYFYGGYDQNGESWCSDCVIAKPNIEAASKELENQEKVFLYKFPVDDRVEWKKPDFIFRTHPKVKLDRVPTLIFYQNGVEFGRLIEDQLFDQANVIDFFKQALE